MGACEIETLQQITPHQTLKRCKVHGIAFVEDRSTGLAHSAHPDIDQSGSISGMRGRGWGWTDKVVACRGYRYNVDMITVSDELDRIAASACQCGREHPPEPWRP